MSVPGESVFRRRAGSEWSRFGSDYVVLDSSGRFLRGLNATGALVWELLDGQRSVEGIAQQIASELGVAQETARSDVAAFLSALETRALVDRVQSAAAEAAQRGGTR